jgi:nucleoside-diphosphate-sugar epimerase
VKEGKPLVIYGDGNQTRDFIYAEDVCEAIYLSLDSDYGGEIFQIGTGKETRIIDLAKKIKSLSGKNLKIEFKPPRKGEIRRNYSNITKAQKILDYEPKVSLDEGLTSTYKWFMTLG